MTGRQNRSHRVGVATSSLRGRSEMASLVFVCVLWVLVRCTVVCVAHISQSLNILSCFCRVCCCVFCERPCAGFSNSCPRCTQINGTHPLGHNVANRMIMLQRDEWVAKLVLRRRPKRFLGKSISVSTMSCIHVNTGECRTILAPNGAYPLSLMPKSATFDKNLSLSRLERSLFCV